MMLESMMYRYLLHGSYLQANAWCPRCCRFSASDGDGFGMLRCRSCGIYHAPDSAMSQFGDRRSFTEFFKKAILPLFQRKKSKPLTPSTVGE